ncbi:MAG: DUF2178 domain-containing protein [Promethearchaeota archaeon]|jgi:uncharacterized membrane protein
MDKERYNNLKTIIVIVLGLVVAFGAVRQSWTLPLLTLLIGIVFLITIRKQVTDVLYDERTIVIQQKASSRTLGYLTALTGFLGLILIEMSYRGFPDYKLVGYAFVYQAFIFQGVYALFMWYYQRQLGG